MSDTRNDPRSIPYCLLLKNKNSRHKARDVLKSVQY